MEEIMKMLAAYNKNPRSLSSPSISDEILNFLAPGLDSATKIDSRRDDPFFSYGSDATYECKNKDGETMTITLWGNTDGWGMSKAKS